MAIDIVDNVHIVLNEVDIVNKARSDRASTVGPDDADDADGAAVMELIHDVMHRHRSRQFQALRDGLHAVTHMEAKVLGFFDHRPGATQSDLAQYSGRDKAQLARLVKGLRDRGLLAGEAVATDRRSVKLSLTAEGQAVQRSLRGQARLLGRRVVAGLDAAEQQSLLSLLRHLQRNLDTDDGSAGP